MWSTRTTTTGRATRRSNGRSSTRSIYELHVAGFTRNPNSGVAAAKRGTYAGLIEKIPYLVDLGIKTVELMPVQQFDAQAAPNGTNYWGYQPVAWFAPHRAYSSQSDSLGPVNEFRDLVKALHRAGIEVILDVVFNHTAEGDATGPTLSLRGIDNPTYYILDPANPADYVDDTGCGNTINGNKPVVRRMIVDCLRHWVEHMHVDGFRFDLAASLSRGEDGEPLDHPPILTTSKSIPCWPAPRSSPRPGMRPGCISWRTLAATAGPFGTASSATTCGSSSKATNGNGRPAGR